MSGSLLGEMSEIMAEVEIGVEGGASTVQPLRNAGIGFLMRRQTAGSDGDGDCQEAAGALTELII